MASWASLPRRPATSKPSPISTPLTAWMLITAWASRASSLRSQWTWLPRPTGTPSARTSTTPPSESPSFAAALISRIIASAAAGVEAAHRLTRRPRRGRRTSAVRPLDVAWPICTTWERTWTPSSASSSLATRPGRDAGRGLPGAGPLEDVTGVGEAVLLHPGEVGVARAAPGSAGTRSRPVPGPSRRATCRCGTTRCS